jgi:hypothetical protein
MKRLLICFAIVMLIISPAFAGLGVSVENKETPLSADILFSNMIRSGYSEKIIHISSNNPGTTHCTVKVTGDIKDWVDFVPGIGIDVPQNSDVQLKMIVNLPDDLANGVYKGMVTITAEASESSEGDYQIGVSSAVALKAEIDVTGEQLYSFVVGEISVGDTEVGIPIQVSAKIKNDGNVAVKPFVNVTISDNNGSELVAKSYSEKIILASQSDEIVFAVPSDKLKVGQYWVDVLVYYENGTVAGEKKLTFDVLEKGAFSIKGELVQIENKVWAKTGEVVKINAVFQNNGELITTAKFQGEVYLDNTLVKTISSEQLSASPGEKVNLTTYFTPENGGRYVIRGNVVYSEKITETKESIINVNPESVVPLGVAGISIIGAAIVAGVLGFRFMCKKRKEFMLVNDYES